jgi:hypothetical protein
MSKFSCFVLATPPGGIIVIDQSETLSRSQVQFNPLFLGGAQLCCAFYQRWQAARILANAIANGLMQVVNQLLGISNI